MNILCPENVSANCKRKRIIRELVQGQEYATKLKFLLQKPFGPGGSLSAEELAASVLRSFTHSLSILTSSEAVGGGQNLLCSVENGSSPAAGSSNNPRSQDSGESGNTSSPAIKERRGCYKRRKTAQTWTIVSHTSDDNHAWRKYGQKEILNSKFPRSYFRCTRKYDQGCLANKQVQRMQENPDKYQITYIGIHTCKDTLKASYLVTDDYNARNSFLVNTHLDSKSEVPSEIAQDQSISSKTPTTIKEEYPKEDTQSDLTDNLDPNLWSDLKEFELSKPSINMPLKMASDNSDIVYPCNISQGLQDMDFEVFSAHFSNDFHFDGDGSQLF